MMAQGNYQSELMVEQREFNEMKESNSVALLQTSNRSAGKVHQAGTIGEA